MSRDTEHQIRPGTQDELDQLRQIETLAGAVFAEYNMAAVADDDPPDIAVLAEYCAAGRL